MRVATLHVPCVKYICTSMCLDLHLQVMCKVFYSRKRRQCTSFRLSMHINKTLFLLQRSKLQLHYRISNMKKWMSLNDPPRLLRTHRYTIYIYGKECIISLQFFRTLMRLYILLCFSETYAPAIYVWRPFHPLSNCFVNIYVTTYISIHSLVLSVCFNVNVFCQCFLLSLSCLSISLVRIYVTFTSFFSIL